MKRFAAKLFYLGHNYHGSQYQPNVDTVQGRLITALSDWDGSAHNQKTVQFSSRTDRGVSSIGQLITIDTEKELNINGINRRLPEDVILWSSQRVDSQFNPRYHSLMRCYNYIAVKNTEGSNISLMKRAARKMIGTNDYKFLSKPDGSRGTTATILNISIGAVKNQLVIEIYGTHFLWHLVRKLSTVLHLVGEGKIDWETYELLISGVESISSGIQPAPPEGLFLMDVVSPIHLKPDKSGLKRIRRLLTHRLAYLNRCIQSLSVIAEKIYPL